MPVKWDVDFSLALHNRTGKYFIGRDLIEDHRSRIAKVRYWRIAARMPPSEPVSRILGKLMVGEHIWRAGAKARTAPKVGQPLLHLDPMSVLHAGVSPNHAVLCHDVGPITHPELFTPAVSTLYGHAYDLISEARPSMVFVSEASRAAFTGLHGDWGTHAVIPPPIRTDVRQVAPQPVPSVGENFLLTVGSIGRRKNQTLAMEAFERSGLADQGYQYVMCGAREPGSEDVVERATRTAGVVLLSYLSAAELAWLYRRASGFVLPSRLEGFGIPVAEAMAYGLIPIVSRGSVLEEVAGPGGLTTDPMDADELAARMVELLSLSAEDRAARLDMLSRSLQRFTRERFRSQWREILTAGGEPRPQTVPTRPIGVEEAVPASGPAL